jgi:molybdopterin molybdotransferase
MDIDIQLTRGRIPELPPTPATGAGTAGAWVEFRGVVRGEENGLPIAALEYEAYEEMAVREMRRIVEDLGRECPCLAVRVRHRLGVVPAGEVALSVGVAGRHRNEAFALLTKFMDRLKQDVPIWKQRALALANPLGGVRPPSAPGVEQVLARVRAGCRPLEAEGVALDRAAGRVLREVVCAPENQPPFDRSAVDGFAVRLDDPATEFSIVDDIRAGDWKPRRLQPGTAVRIATGGALPCDGLQVVMKEGVQLVGARVRLLRRDTSRNIRSRGEEARAGQVLLKPGTVLRPGSLALLASLGQVQPLVTRRPRVLHVATGNEIVPPDQVPQQGQIRDSNSTLVRAFLGSFDVEPAQLRVADDRAQTRAAMGDRPQAVDLLLVSGGASVGEHDFTGVLLEESGFRIDFRRTNTRPGKPLIFATREDGALAFGLPGNPLAHFVCLNLFVRAALEKLAGLPERNFFSTAVLAGEVRSDGDSRETLWPARVKVAGGCAEATPLPWCSSGDLTALAAANALLHLPAGCQVLSAGAEVAFASTLTPA